MKKIFALVFIIICIVSLFSLCSCESKKNTTQNTETVETTVIDTTAIDTTVAVSVNNTTQETVPQPSLEYTEPNPHPTNSDGLPIIVPAETSVINR